MEQHIEPGTISIEGLPQPTPAKIPLLRVARYLLRRILSIGLTIFVGVFITVVIANRGGMLDKIISDRIEQEIFWLNLDSNFQGDLDAQRSALEASSGLSLKFIPKHVLYTIKSLELDWGSVWDTRKFSRYIETDKGVISTDDSRVIILSQLPNTLLLSGIAYLLLVLIGIPLALYLSQHENSWLDRLTGALTPLSSVPSWVIGVLLVMIFAVQLKILPVGKMIDILPPENTWQTITTVARHLALPVAAIVLSLIFQLTATWRTYLLIYSEENYVTLAKSMGLKKWDVYFNYILRPVLPYMLTSLLMTLAGFWQTITALEYTFQWPGIGSMFVDALPNFRGESMYRGEMTIVVGIVVLFAYLLGITVFALDFLYALVDPRIRAEPPTRTTLVRLKKEKKSFPVALNNPIHSPTGLKTSVRTGEPAQTERFQPAALWKRFLANLHIGMQSFRKACRSFFHEVFRVPTAVAGLVMVVLLVLTSIAVMIFMPYEPVGRLWSEGNLSGTPTTAKLALPKWVNWFRKEPLPETIVLDSKNGTAVKTVTAAAGGITQVQIDYTIDYPYQEFPSDMSLYVSTEYIEKMPFISLTWITPDGREIQLKNTTVENSLTYNFDENVPFRQLVKENAHWQKWFVSSGNFRTPGYTLLFADPLSDTGKALKGRYTLRVNGMLFEEGKNLDASLVVFGKVEGWAGTDYLRRDLLVPLLWGLPIALVIGVVGTVVTTLLSLLLAAASAWLGGWVDALIQRATEANLILPVLAIGVLLYSYYNLNLWLILILIILLNIFGSPTKAFRAALLQEKQAGYIEAAQIYGASNGRIITHYLIPRILPVVIPQIVILIPNFFFLEATLAIFNVSDQRFPTWGRVVYSALRYGATYGSQYWVLEPIAMMLITGLAFILLGFALNRILNPQLRSR